ncbi:MAG: S8 family serine peptidase [Chloroflexota bacterium]|nr:S8 family serine peptidase [Chloroflexota bacterium]
MITTRTTLTPRHRPTVPMARLVAAIGLVAITVLGHVAPALASMPAPAGVPAVAQAAVEGPVIVVLESGAEPVRTLRESDIAANPGRSFTRAIQGFSANLTAAEVGRLARNPRVRSITPDLPVYAQEQTLPTGIDRIEADRNATASIDGGGGGVDASIAILDSGIDTANADLSVAGGVNCLGSGGFADVNGHGTHVAGIAAARDNDFGTVGVAPGASLYAVRVLGADLSGSYSSLICGLEWVIANAGSIDVANMSVAGSGSDSSCTAEPLHQAICNTVAAGVTVVVAAGNFGRDASTTVPATFAEVITVSAFNDYNGAPGGGAAANCSTSNAAGDDRFASYSNFGGDVDIVAPGTCIRSAAIGGGTAFRSGTSMASPHVAGAAALYRATNPGASPSAVRNFVLGQSVSQGSSAGITGDPDGSGEPVLQVGVSTPPATATATAVSPTTAPPTATPSGRIVRGGTATSTPRATPTATLPPPGVTPPPTSSVPTATPSGRVVRGGVATATAPPPGVTPVPTSSLPTATPGSRTIRGTSVETGTATGGRTARRLPPTAVLPTIVPPTAALPTSTAVPPTATATALPPQPTETLAPVSTEVPATEAPATVPAPSPYAVASVTDDSGDQTAWFAVDGDPTTGWFADSISSEASGVPDPSGATDDRSNLILDLGAGVPVGQVRWVFSETGFADQFEVQVSADGLNWQTVATRENAPAGEWQETFAGLSARYVKFSFANPNGDAVVGGIGDVQVLPPPA